ncbi:MAG: Pseudouridine synthase [candidate division TM6 bacterium GW2011_GWF2_32_72]|nr:MAG: Pseudouridine synthase [candidate division TM6 bacterium GW2011_GWF2_32_72]
MNSNNINQGEKGVALNKFLADAGICSRRNAEKFIKEGLVTVNGQKITNPAHRIIEKDAVKYNNKLIKNSKKVYILLNKPKGYLCTLNDETGRKNVTDLVEGATKERIYPVGRLDMDTTGLIIMTNDGELTQRLAHPKYNIKKVYIATLHKPLEESHLQEFKKGVVLVDGPIKPDNIKLLGHAPSSHVLVELHSGRNRIVRRMFEHFGYFVDKLERTQYAFLKTQDLEVGKWRRLTGQEVDELKKQSYASKETPIPKKISNIIKAKKAKLELERRNETTKETKLQNCSSGCCSTKPGSFNKPKRNQQEYLKDQELNEKKWIKATGQNEENYIETDLPDFSDFGSRDSDSKPSRLKSSEFRKPDYRRNRSDRPASRYGSSRPDFRKSRSDRFESNDSEYRKPRYSDSGDSDSRENLITEEIGQIDLLQDTDQVDQILENLDQIDLNPAIQNSENLDIQIQAIQIQDLLKTDHQNLGQIDLLQDTQNQEIQILNLDQTDLDQKDPVQANPAKADQEQVATE